MANSNGWGDGAANNAIGWGQGANNAIAWGDSHAKSWAGATDIVGLTTDPDAQAFITAAAITDPTQQLAIDNLVKGLKSDNIWTKMKAIYPFVGGTASTHKWNLKDPRDLDAAFRLVFNGGWTHSSNGATPNGTNAYADTKFIANTHLTKGDGHLSYYSRTNSADSSGSTTMGDNTGGRGRIVLRRSSDIAYMECGTNGADSRTYTVTDSRCYAVANVISNQNVDFFRNGIKQTATAINSSNQGWSTGVIGIGGSVANGQYDNKQCAFSTIGNGLTDTDAANLYTRVQAYQTALSRQV